MYRQEARRRRKEREKSRLITPEICITSHHSAADQEAGLPVWELALGEDLVTSNRRCAEDDGWNFRRDGHESDYDHALCVDHSDRYPKFRSIWLVEAHHAGLVGCRQERRVTALHTPLLLLATPVVLILGPDPQAGVGFCEVNRSCRDKRNR